jgi:hypothetical protein
MVTKISFSATPPVFGAKFSPVGRGNGELLQGESLKKLKRLKGLKRLKRLKSVL